MGLLSGPVGFIVTVNLVGLRITVETCAVGLSVRVLSERFN